MTEDRATPNPLENMSDEEVAEFSCRSLIRSLLKSRDEPADVTEALDYARKTLVAGAESLLGHIAAITDESERIDAFGDIEFLIGGALRIGAGVPLPEVEKVLRRSPGRPPSVDYNALGAEVLRLMDHHGDFVAGDPEWNAQARLEEAIAERFGLSTNRARDLLKKPLEEWRRRRGG